MIQEENGVHEDGVPKDGVSGDGVPAETGLVRNQKTTHLAVVCVCAFLSVVFLKSGILSLFFLVPLGFAMLAYGASWLPCAITAFLNIAVTVIFQAGRGSFSPLVWINILYFTAVYFGFAWIICGSRIRTLYRLMLASAAGAVLYQFEMSAGGDAGYSLIAEIMSSIMISSSGGADAVTHSLMREMFTPDKILATIKAFMMRGGAFAALVFEFFISRQITYTALFIIKKQQKNTGLSAFFAPPFTIWVFSGSLAFILLTRLFRVEILEITAWNVSVICAIIFIAQGAGIVMDMLSRRPFGFRTVAVMLVIFLLISPGINAIVLAVLLLLGIAENWLPLRAAKQEKASTPGL